MAIMVLPQSAKAADDIDSDLSPALIVMKDSAGWYMVQAPLMSREEMALTKAADKLGSQIAAMLRPVQNQLRTIGLHLSAFHDLGRRRAELCVNRTSRVRVVCSSEGANGPEHLVREGDLDDSILDGVLESHANVMAWLDELLAPLQGRHVEAEADLGLLPLPVPRTLDEWRAARRTLEARLAALGFSTREIAELLPDGRGDARRRVAMRRKRLQSSGGTTPEN